MPSPVSDRTRLRCPGWDAKHFHEHLQPGELGDAGAPASCRNPVDSLAQSCGLSLPTFNQRDWFMTLSIDAASSPACIASTSSASPQEKRVDFLTRYCGLSRPTLFKRIGIMAADGQPLPTRFDAARRRRVSRPELAWHTGNPSSGPHVQAGLLVKTPLVSIASGPADGQATAIPLRVGKGFSGHLSAAKTTPTIIPSGPAGTVTGAARQLERDDGCQAVEQPYRQHQPGRLDMRARAGPFA